LPAGTRSLLHWPTDNARLRARYEGRDGGVCGPAAVAALEHRQVQEVIDAWAVPFHGCSPVGELFATLEALGFAVARRLGRKASEFPRPATDRAIARVQWLREDGSEWFYRQAPRYSHFVAMRRDPATGVWWAYCNSRLWFRAHGREGDAYLNAGSPRGYISSYLELSRPD
jgi:hypothetical protein